MSIVSGNAMKVYLICSEPKVLWGFPGGSDGKESACNAGDWDLIHGSQRSPGEGNGLHGQRSLAGNSLWDHKELDTTK